MKTIKRQSVRQDLEEIIDQRLNELTSQHVKIIIKQMIHKHLGWLVVWGGVFGFFIGIILGLFGKLKLTSNSKKIKNLNFINSYSKLPEKFFEKKNPTPVKNPKLLKLNNDLCDFLNLDKNYLIKKPGFLILSGNTIDKSSKPISMAYAGHQFGHFVEKLGDGRAALLGEIKARNGKLFDIQLKGSEKLLFLKKWRWQISIRFCYPGIRHE